MNRTGRRVASAAALAIDFALAILPVLVGSAHAAEPTPPPVELRVATEAGAVQGQREAGVTSFQGPALCRAAGR